jgi:hypothetical protein
MPTVLGAFKWSATFGSWEDHQISRNAGPVIEAALARARSRSKAGTT